MTLITTLYCITHTTFHCSLFEKPWILNLLFSQPYSNPLLASASGSLLSFLPGPSSSLNPTLSRRTKSHQAQRRSFFHLRKPDQSIKMPSKHTDGDSKRALPKKQNPLLAPNRTTDRMSPTQGRQRKLADCSNLDAELIRLRRLGRTNLSVGPTQIGLNNATQPENLGPFDYAHLRAPLPEDLKGSQVFAPQLNQPVPTSYFLMVSFGGLIRSLCIPSLTIYPKRRSQDGYVSATGMFKAAFPWAKHSEEQAEKDYIKSLPSTSQNEIAGNLWIKEDLGLWTA